MAGAPRPRTSFLAAAAAAALLLVLVLGGGVAAEVEADVDLEEAAHKGLDELEEEIRKIKELQARRIHFIGVGLPSTGTQSLVEALRHLGYESAHGADFYLNMTMRRAWISYLHEGGPFEPAVDTLLDHGYTAVTDAPTVLGWRDMIARFPDAKVVLTVRDSAEKWYQSFSTKAHHPEGPGLWTMQFQAWLLGLELDAYWMFLRNNQAKYGCNFRDVQTPEIRESCIAGYNAHIEAVKKAIPPERLLVYSVKQGWAPLCDYLRVPVPDIPFPKQDRTKEQESISALFNVIWSDLQTNRGPRIWLPALLLWSPLWLVCPICSCCLLRSLCRCLCGSRQKNKSEEKAGKLD